MIPNDHAPEDTTPASLRDTLRLATRPLHEALDRALAGAFRSRASYVAFLRGSHAALAWISPEIERLGALPAPDGVGRVDRISRDLAALGAEPGASITMGPHAAPNPSASPWRPTSVAEAFGAAYVIEGSALGGLSLVRIAEESLKLGGDAMSYLRLRGADTARHWRAFLDTLERWGAGATAAERRDAVEGAKRTFLTYRRAFEIAGVIPEAS